MAPDAGSPGSATSTICPGFRSPPTGAASTISLPAAAPDGTRLHFVADGTKNGHAITYRDVTTALTTALTASKVHGVTVVCRNNAWAVTGLYVSP